MCNLPDLLLDFVIMDVCTEFVDTIWVQLYV